ncbi:3,4-dihydroxy-2-butanone 4-phosphate synthase [Rhodococcus opacus PD630]|uniref:3,4-dihydroxy-2-butanone-4-phosphate synthase n=1 Tax=Rhodococcus opacus TaxID=37919 RepID=UPI00029CC86C|nr:3,4-dihydroxy-2-butanone-4-phosphate synthase [Rhodococcus opacus]AHK34491.1 Riboflavin biosynthesis protein ribBA [Rhodococcus opacus PD630]EHI39610.1 3,4-dihydroxy-2-butanone 4-phosphate synthase [Rhodococcus opacus PD630]UDG96639.1 3,4-dihydroxy-2-butanone-4-phosphate synthase [Rhodococcus opacus PD630]
MRVDAALASLREGRPVFTVDSTGAGAVVLAAHGVDMKWVAWTVRHTSGLLCAPMSEARADELDLPPMVPRNQVTLDDQYTVSVDARHGVTTGISAVDRARTFRTLAAPCTSPADLVRPGHVLPLCTHSGGVFERLTHPEAAVDLCTLAGLPQVAVLATLVADQGHVLPRAGIEDLAAKHSLPVLDIGELLTYTRRAEYAHRGVRGAARLENRAVPAHLFP